MAYLPSYLIAVQLQHLYIEEKYFRLDYSEGTQGLLAVVHDSGLVAIKPKKRGERFRSVLIVVGNKNPSAKGRAVGDQNAPAFYRHGENGHKRYTKTLGVPRL